MAETRTVTVELASGKTYEIDNVVEDTFAFYPIPNSGGQNLIIFVLTDSIGRQYKFAGALVVHWVSRPKGN